jgi:hypothetical protein
VYALRRSKSLNTEKWVDYPFVKPSLRARRKLIKAYDTGLEEDQECFPQQF